MNYNTVNDGDKVCKKCNGVFPATSKYWHKDKKAKDGFRSDCKKCRNKEGKFYRMNNQESIIKKRKENREYHREYSKKYKEENKDQIKIKDARYRDKNREILREKHRMWRSENKERLNEQYREYYRKNKNQIRQRKTFLYKENIEEMREKGRIRTQKYLAAKRKLEHSLTEEQWKLTLDYFDESCAYCGIERDVLINNTGVDLNQEHFIPLSKGGGYTLDNIVPSCRSCNSSKINKNFFDWYKKQDYYSKQREIKILEFLGYKDNEQKLSSF